MPDAILLGLHISLTKEEKTMKRALIILCTMGIMVLAGCSKDDTAGKTGAAPEETVRDITLFCFNMGPVQSGLKEVEAAVNEISVPSIKVRVKLMISEVGSYPDQLSMMMSSQEKIDLTQAIALGSARFNNVVAQNQFMDIGDLLEKYAPELLKTVNGIIPNYLEGTRVNGKIYGVAGFFSKVTNYYYFVREDLLKKHSLSIDGIKNLDDLEAFLKKIKAAEPNMAALSAGSSDADILQMANGGYYNVGDSVVLDNVGDTSRLGAVFFTSPRKVVNLYKTPEYRKKLEWARRLYQAGLVYKDAAINTEMAEELVKANKVASWITGSELGAESAKSAITGYPIKALKLQSGLITTTAMRRFVWGIPSFSKEAEAAIKFLNLMYTDARITDLLNWGIEGRDYVQNPDGTIGYPEGITAQTVPYHSSDFIWGNQFITKIWEGNPPNLGEMRIKENREALPSVLMGFSYDPTPVQNELSSITNVIAQYRPSLESGTADPAVELPRFLKALDDAGADKIIAEIQRQLDVWWATKE
jgi:putative aldouronate transport system substrate-binding protein